ncbi:hypothetical protein NADFUDRAFT_84339 [Nadsonia fulvescens var. elongata DSM 6958]|uniref:Glycerophosphocholine acyltransferase 1 n=1 Tax=Nadsonia fulvescens var. elongata DSM 6958 TaxID=857566 RepID=A0A1E3PFT1_9ASCO|nr:hypothetical protein NADFUDRAFT_84339 [Nadsonia fulvescens var. elongata DSM 6958]
MSSRVRLNDTDDLPNANVDFDLDVDGTDSSPKNCKDDAIEDEESDDSLDSLDLDYESQSGLSDLFNLVSLLSNYSVTTSQKLQSHKHRSKAYLKSLQTLATRKKNEKLDEIGQYKLKVLQTIDQKLQSQTLITTSEKLWFSFGVINIFYCGLVIGSCPEWFHIIYTAQLLVLMPLRIHIYRKRQFHYFLLDLCYFVNLLCLIFIWILPTSETLFVCCYAFTFGTLSWAVLTWRNSLVLHSLDKTTSTFIHLCPPVVFHVIQHCLDKPYQATRFPALISTSTQSWPFIHGLLITSIFYAIWQALYHYFITYQHRDKIQAGRVTSFVWLKKVHANKPLGKFVCSFNERNQVFVYMAMQYVYQLSTMLPIGIWYSSKLASMVFLSFIFSVAAFNGASYYIDVFGTRFKKELLKAK